MVSPRCRVRSKVTYEDEVVDGYTGGNPDLTPGRASTYTAGVETSGIDLQLDWRADAGPGEASVSWLVGWLGSYVYQATSEVHREQWRNTAFVISRWASPGNTLVRCRTTSILPSTCRREGTSTSPWLMRFKAGPFDGLCLRAGVTSVLNQDPPIFPSYQQANTDPSVYDLLCRRYFVGLNYAVRPNRH